MIDSKEKKIEVEHFTKAILDKMKEPEAIQAKADKLYHVASSGFGGHSPWTVRSLEHSLDSENSLVIQATLDLEVVGFLMASETKVELDIYLIVVAEAFKRQHIGVKLLDYLIEYGEGKDLDLIILEARASNTPAINLYKRVGFEEVGLRRAYYSSPIEDAIVMRRDLKKEMPDC